MDPHCHISASRLPIPGSIPISPSSSPPKKSCTISSLPSLIIAIFLLALSLFHGLACIQPRLSTRFIPRRRSWSPNISVVLPSFLCITSDCTRTPLTTSISPNHLYHLTPSPNSQIAHSLFQFWLSGICTIGYLSSCTITRVLVRQSTFSVHPLSLHACTSRLHIPTHPQI